MSRCFQFRLRSLFRLTLAAALLCLVGPPAWTWVEATLWAPDWQDIGQPGPILEYHTTIGYDFGLGSACERRAKEFRLKLRLNRLRANRIRH